MSLTLHPRSSTFGVPKSRHPPALVPGKYAPSSEGHWQTSGAAVRVQAPLGLDWRYPPRPGIPALSPRGSGPALLRPRLRASLPRIAPSAEPWPEVALCAPHGSRRRTQELLTSVSFLFFPPSQFPAQGEARPYAREWGLRERGGHKRGMRQAAAPSLTWVRSHLEMWVEVPHSGAQVSDPGRGRVAAAR